MVSVSGTTCDFIYGKCIIINVEESSPTLNTDTEHYFGEYEFSSTKLELS